MKNKKLIISVLIGMLAGQIFAEGDRPFSVINTLRVGYDDNVYRTTDDQEKSAYIQDIIDLSFRAALSDRTDLTFQSRFDYRSDKEQNFYPNLYAILTHSASPRLLLQLSDKFTSGSTTSASRSGKYNYLINTLSFVPSYVLDSKNSLSLPLSYSIKRHEEIAEKLDYDTVSAGLSWKRQLIPQQTWASLSLSQKMIDYVNRDSQNDITFMSATISHTFNPNWQGQLGAGVTYNQSEFSIPLPGGSSRTITSDGVNPYFLAGLTYAPTPQTRFTADLTQQYQESDSLLYAGKNSRSLSLGFQHDFTARIMGKATARFTRSEYDNEDNEVANSIDLDEDYVDLGVRVHYKLNRNNFIELGLTRREKMYDNEDRDWDQNRVDIGWRVTL